MSEDERWMQRCLELAEGAWGKTSPNPMVGAVVVREGTVVGEGFHPKAGEPHAEVFALRAAGTLARGATLYVNLEPCNHHGRTPPCTVAILEAGIRRVVIGMADPNPKARGGAAHLRAAGVEVTTGILEAACTQFNEAFAHFVATGLPFGVLKYAMTLDGKTATGTGHSFWVSGEAARRRVHHLRAGYDCVIVGGNTVRLDDPQLTVRLVAGRNPLRVVLCRRLNLPRQAHLWDQQAAPTLVLTGPEADPGMRDYLLALGVAVESLDPLTPGTAIAHLGRRSCQSALWECGGTLAWSALQDGALQKIVAFVAPALVGGQFAATPVGGEGIDRMDRAIRLERVVVEAVGEDWMYSAYL